MYVKVNQDTEGNLEVIVTAAAHQVLKTLYRKAPQSHPVLSLKFDTCFELNHYYNTLWDMTELLSARWLKNTTGKHEK